MSCPPLYVQLEELDAKIKEVEEEIKEVKGEIVDAKAEVKRLLQKEEELKEEQLRQNAQMEEGEANIKKVEKDIEKVVGELKDARHEVKRLGKKEERLGKKEEQLRNKEQLLLEEKLIGAKGSRGNGETDGPEGSQPCNIPKPGEIVSWLDEKFGDDLRRVHLMDLPGARRTGERVDKGTLQEYMSLEGREKTLQQFIYWAAIMFRRWCLRGGNDSTEYYRGLSQELFVSFPGAGKTTFMEMLPRLLREWLSLGYNKCLAALRGAMFSHTTLSKEEAAVPGLLLKALHMLAGTQKDSYHFFLLLRVFDQAVPLHDYEPSTTTGAALRILHAALSPLDTSAPRMSFRKLVANIDKDMRRSVHLTDVLELIRTALGVPPDEILLLVLMTDESNAAEGCFGQGEVQTAGGHKATWVLQLMSHVIHEMSKITSDTPPTFIVPLTASTQYEAVDLNRLRESTLTRASRAVQLNLPILTVQQCQHVIKVLCARVAKANNRMAEVSPDSVRLPQAVLDCLALVGGSPRLLSYLLEEIVGSKDWTLEFDRCVEGVKATHVKTMLEAVIVKGHAQLFWRRFLSNEEDNQLKLECLRRIVTIMLTDEPVKRSDVLAGTPGNGPTVGMFEAMGLVQCEVQGSDVIPFDAERLQHTAGGSSAACSSETPPSGLHGRASSAQAEAGNCGDVDDGSPSSASSACLTPARMMDTTPPRPVGRGAMGIPVLLDKVIYMTPPPENSPGNAALVDGSLSSVQPTAAPGSHIVRLTVSYVALAFMLRQLKLMKEEELSVYSSHVDRESPGDREVVDGMMIPLKLEAFAVSGKDKVTFEELFRGLRVPVPAAGKRFLVPRGHLVVAPDGQRQASWLSPQDVAGKIEESKQAILRSREATAGGEQRPDITLSPQDVARNIEESKQAILRSREATAGGEQWPDITIGFVGVGNRGLDSLVVLVDEEQQAWPVVLQSKQTDTATFETVRGVLDNMESDLRKTFNLPPLPEARAQWHKGWKPKQVPEVARQQPGSHPGGAQQPAAEAAAESPLLPFDRVLYIYVSDGRFSEKQDDQFKKVVAEGHPWLERVTVVSYQEAACFYTRVGALKRSVMRKAVTSKIAKPA